MITFNWNFYFYWSYCLIIPLLVMTMMLQGVWDNDSHRILIASALLFICVLIVQSERIREYKYKYLQMKAKYLIQKIDNKNG